MQRAAPRREGVARPAAHAEGPPRAARWAPWIVVGLAVAWNLITLRAETLSVSYLDDSSVHAQMVRFATAQIGAGHLPLTSWFPYLGLGSPQFLHYQSLPAMVTGLLGTAIGAGNAFRWSIYLLLSLWPVSIYLGARLFGIGRWGAAASAVLSPFLVSATGIGYEAGAYVWIGYGVWTQLWASLTLPLAWGLGWRAIRDGGSLFGAALAIALTIALHFETGYLALLPLLLWPFVAARKVRVRLARAAVVLGGALLASAWVIVPLLVERPWAATNQVLHRTPLVNGYGAPQVLGWLAGGRLLDSGRLPVITVLAGIGLLVVIRRWRVDENGRSLVVLLGLCLLLSFGQATLGVLVDAIPGHADLFFRRFMMGVQLSALLLAGVGAAWCCRMAWGFIRSAQRRWGPGTSPASRPGARAVLIGAAAILVLAPAWSQLLGYTRRNSRAIHQQISADGTAGAQVDRLLAVVRRGGAGRVYAGMPSNWGANFRVGAVPVLKYLEARDVDEAGYTLRTASLMTDPEYFFDDGNLSDYLLLGIRYVIVPVDRRAPVTSAPLGCAGYYCLREVPSGGYVHVGRLVGVVGVNRSNVAGKTLPILRSRLAQHGYYVRADFGHGSKTPLTLPAAPMLPFHGAVLAQRSDIERGRMAAKVAMGQPGVAVLGASFDPGWKAAVDGRPAPVVAVAPALVGVRIPAGRHTVAFRYEGFSGYPWLFALSATSLLALAAVEAARRRRGKDRPAGGRVGSTIRP